MKYVLMIVLMVGLSGCLVPQAATSTQTETVSITGPTGADGTTGSTGPTGTAAAPSGMHEYRLTLVAPSGGYSGDADITATIDDGMETYAFDFQLYRVGHSYVFTAYSGSISITAQSIPCPTTQTTVTVSEYVDNVQRWTQTLDCSDSTYTGDL